MAVADLDRAAAPSEADPARLMLVAHVARPGSAGAVRRVVEAELVTLLAPDVVEAVGAAMGELFIVTCGQGTPANVGVAVSEEAVTVDVRCPATEPPEPDETSHRLLTGLSDMWGVEVGRGACRCWARIAVA